VFVRLVFILSLLFFAVTCWAEERKEVDAKDRKEAKLEEIVVTATRTPKELDTAPGSVSLITSADIEKRNIKTIDEALNVLPGVFHRDWFGRGMNNDVSLRGFSGQNRTLVLLDGIALNNAYTGAVQWAGFAPESMERLEVVRGPFSSLYGGYAMGGVVNIITKMPEKREFILKSGYGTGFERGKALDDLKSFYLSYGDRFVDKISLFVSYGYKGTNGYAPNLNVQSLKPPDGITGWMPTKSNQGAARYIIGDSGDNRWWDDNITLKAGYDFSKTTKLLLTFIRSRSEYNYDDPHTYLRDSTGKDVWTYTAGSTTVRESSFLPGPGGREQNLYNIGFETEILTAKARLSIGFVDQDTSWYTTAGTTATRTGGPGKLTDTPAKSFNSEVQFTFPIANKHVFTFGASYRTGHADSKESNLTNWNDEKSKTTLAYQSKGKDRTFALFLQDEIMLMDNLTAYVGLRQDWWETYDGYVNQVGTAGYPKKYEARDSSSLSPKAALVYKPFETTALRTSIGKAFRPPTVYDLFRTWTTPSGVTYAANPGLKPETTVSWDIGIEQKLWKGAKIGAAYFMNQMKDMIYRKTITPTLQELINAGKAESKGLEIEAEQRFGKEIRLFTNLTYTDGKMKDNPAKPETVGKRLIQFPKLMFNIGADFEKGPFSAFLTGRYVGKRYQNDENKDVVNNVYTAYDPYFTADAKVSYKLTKFASISLAINNIFDREYYSYYKAPGRSWFGEVTFKF